MSGPINNIDEHLVHTVAAARKVIADDGGIAALVLADLVLELHEHLRHGERLPAVWSVAKDGRVRG